MDRRGSHPRSAGTFAKFIEEFVVKQRRLSIEEAVRKMTSLPASTLGLRDRGTIRPGASADLVLFDASAALNFTALQRWFA